MTRFIILILTISFSLSANCQQVAPLNAHKFEITDTIKYKPVFYRHVIEDSDSSYYSATYDSMGNLSDISYTWLIKVNKRKVPTQQISVTFTSSGDTLMRKARDLGERTERIHRYDKGILFSEVYREDSYFVSGWEITPDGNKIPLTQDRFAPRLKNNDELGIWLDRNMKYPKLARRKGIEGYIYMILTVDPEGHLKAMEVGNPEFEPLFEAEALRVLASFNWDFEPEEDRFGNPVEGILSLPILFRMR